MDISNRLPSRLIIVAGTYDGVLAGWDTSSEHIQEEETDIQKKHYDIDLKLLRRKNDGKYLKLSFAMSAHEGSVRCLDVSGGGISSNSTKNNDDKKKKKRQRSDSVDSSNKQQEEEDVPLPGSLLSGGYDETINVFNLQKHNQVGELKTPSDLGSPLCCAFAPPSNSNSTTTTTGVTTTTHALVGLTSGKIILYKKKDMSVQHILSGHDTHGVQCIAVHPTGKMALSGGRSDGKIILWDLMKGRLAFVIKLPKIKVAGGRGGVGKGGGGGQLQTVNHIVWSDDGSRYAYCYGNKITARDVASSASGGNGEEGGADDYLLDVAMPSRVNQLAFVGGPEGIFLCAACDDGGLPVLEVGQLLLDDEDDEEGKNTAQNERRAIMAIEPVDDIVAGDDRFKCIKSVEGGSGFLVVTANSGGIVSLMDLEGAARMMLTPPSEGMGSSGSDSDDNESEDDSDEDEDDDVEAAVEILDSVRIGSGARITDLAVWSYDSGVSEEVNDEIADDGDDLDMPQENEVEEDDEEVSFEKDEAPPTKKPFKKKENDNREMIDMDPEAVDKARKLVVQAKKHQKKKKKKKQKQ